MRCVTLCFRSITWNPQEGLFQFTELQKAWIPLCRNTQWPRFKRWDEEDNTALQITREFQVLAIFPCVTTSSYNIFYVANYYYLPNTFFHSLKEMRVISSRSTWIDETLESKSKFWFCHFESKLSIVMQNLGNTSLANYHENINSWYCLHKKINH